jgi:hypothetical protein
MKRLLFPILMVFGLAACGQTPPDTVPVAAEPAQSAPAPEPAPTPAVPAEADLPAE